MIIWHTATDPSWVMIHGGDPMTDPHPHWNGLPFNHGLPYLIMKEDWYPILMVIGNPPHWKDGSVFWIFCWLNVTVIYIDLYILIIPYGLIESIRILIRHWKVRPEWDQPNWSPAQADPSVASGSLARAPKRGAVVPGLEMWAVPISMPFQWPKWDLDTLNSVNIW